MRVGFCGMFVVTKGRESLEMMMKKKKKKNIADLEGLVHSSSCLISQFHIMGPGRHVIPKTTYIISLKLTVLRKHL